MNREQRMISLSTADDGWEDDLDAILKEYQEDGDDDPATLAALSVQLRAVARRNASNQADAAAAVVAFKQLGKDRSPQPTICYHAPPTPIWQARSFKPTHTCLADTQLQTR